MSIESRSAGTFGFGGATGTGATAFIQGINPFRGVPGAAPLLYAAKGGSNPQAPNWWGSGPNSCITRIRTLVYNVPTTAHVLTLLRPLNFAYVKTAVAKNTATFVLDKDPGVYSTNFRYPLAGGAAPMTVANNAISANDYVAYQLADGTWIYDTVASGTFAALVLTTNVPNITGSTGVPAGTPMFFFGITTDVDPNIGYAHPKLTVVAAASNTIDTTYTSPDGSCLWASLHPGDPLILYSSNATASGIIQFVSGQYVGSP